MIKIIFIKSLSTATDAFRPKDETEVPIERAINLVTHGIAKPKNKAEYAEAKAEYEEGVEAKEELKAKAIASIEQEKLKESAELLKKELESTLDLIFDDEFKSSVNIGDAFDIADDGGYGWSEIDGLKVDLQECNLYHTLLEDLSLCTKIADYKALEKKYLTEEE